MELLNIPVTIPPFVLEHVEKYSEGMRKSGSYKHWAEKRNTTPELAELDDKTGKVGEFVAYWGLKTRYNRFPNKYPDLKIYLPNQKSWEPDLSYAPEFDVHCKTCTEKTVSVAKDKSWVFQHKNNKDGGGKDIEIFGDGCEYDPPKLPAIVALVYIDFWKTDKGLLVGTIPVPELFKILDDPTRDNTLRKPDYKGIKRCIYLSEVLRHEGINA